MLLTARTLESLVAALPRTQLEALVCTSVRGGAPVAQAALVPPPAHAPVRVKAARLGADAGRFASMPDDVFGVLLDALCATSRMTLTTRVCKTFREVAEHHPPTHFVLAEYQQYRTRPHEALWMPPSAWGNLIGPINFLKARGGAVHTLALDLDIAPNAPNNVAAIVDLVRRTPKLTTLALSGKKMTANVMKPLLKLDNALSRLKQLTTLVIGRRVSMCAATTNVLAAASNVETLTIGNRAGPEVLAAAYASWSKKRGAVPLLASLTLEYPEPYLEGVGAICPELRCLTLKGVLFDELRPARVVRLPPALQSLTVTLWAYENRDDEWIEKQHRSADNAALLHRLFRACPVARSISVTWRSYPVNESIVAAKRVGGALQSLPKTIENLELGQMAFDDETHNTFVCADVPHLRSVVLCGCIGTATPAAALRAAGVGLSLRAHP
jgi:hypothetical protein